MSLLVFGHKNPDTDSICSSIALSYLKNQLGFEAKPYALGEVRKEAQFALDYFKVSAPELLTDVKGKDVILVDHNELAQTADGIEEANIVENVDHHKVEISTEVPISIRVMPVGCTCTIVYQMYKENNVEVPYEIAGLLLSAILSDTLLFKSPTCTEQDKEIAKKLAKIAGVDIESYGKEMLKAGTDISDFTPFQVINIDSKEFNDKNAKFEISQVNAVDLDSVFSRQSELEDAINKEIKEKNLDFYMFAATDILNANSKIIAIGNKADTVEKAFGVNLENNTAMLNNVVSRKKQMLPNILNNLN